ncbi:Gfa-like protein [Labilithrix luteola]|uniref:Gfa-like protein n=1 Tax=Labilithrix luteola TaxID=1391654 RepID=A0A0K1Q7G2_9BACT|nr:GFA family protein [Labilithrix luteola]AKV01607.1 Gfa-like protein [Labilithrix luteola]
MKAVQGSCLCGDVAFEITGPALRAVHCHCVRCRKARGSATAANLVVGIDGLRFTRGTELLTSYKVPDAKYFTHTFCKACGSSMPRVDEARGIVVIPMGSLDDDPGVRPMGHIFVDSKAPWHEIHDDLPRFGGPPT